MSDSQLSVSHLRTEYLVDPVGIGVRRPRLSWTLESARRGTRQTTYRIVAAGSREPVSDGSGELWDSGWIESRDTNQVCYDGEPVAARQRIWWAVQVRDDAGAECVSDPACWEMGLLPATDVDPSGAGERSEWQAKWISLPGLAPDRDIPKAQEWDGLVPAPYFRQSFDSDGNVERATLYVTSRGVYDAHLNGAIVGDHTLSPGWTDYHRRIQCQAFDVTDRIVAGENVIGAVVAPGWFSGYVGFGPQCRHYGDTPHLLMQLHIDLADGGEQVIGTDGAWRATTGAVRYGDLLMGEHIDARREPNGWSAPGFDASGWRQVAASAIGSVPIVASVAEPVRTMEVIRPVSINEIAPGTWIVDLGQNIAGRVRLTATGEPGATIHLRHGEMLNPDGTLYTENLRGPLADDTFVLAGKGNEAFEPRFTWHGFRYVEVTGYPGELAADDIAGCFVGSDTTPVGGFTCSDPLINTLRENIVRGQRGNFLSIPTDCPQRDERLGWLGDAQAFVGTAVGNMDVAAFFTKWTQDLRDAQSEAGAFPDVAPRLCDLSDGAPAWADAGVIVPWTIWRTYGDTRLIDEQWSSMVRWMDWLQRANPNLLWQKGRHKDFGDWLSIGADTPKELIGTAYFAYDAKLMAEMATAIGRDDEAVAYDELHRNVAGAFCHAYINDDGSIREGTQTAYCLALHFDLLPDELRDAAVSHLIADLKAHDWHITTGFVGVSYICHVLTEAGHADVAYRLLLRESFPSWKYSILHGATTIWERWDGWTEEDGFQDVGMNSFNHYTLGSVGEWLLRGVAGINATTPGYSSIEIRPCLDRSLDFAEGWYRSIHGEIRSGWTWTDNGYRLDVTVPANVDASITLPESEAAEVTEGGLPLESVDGITLVEYEGEATIVTTGSGSYRFEVVRNR